MVRDHSKAGLRVVSLFEAAKGLLVLLAGCGVLAFIHHDLHHAAEQLVRHFHLNPASRYPRIFLDLADHVSDGKLWMMAFFAVLYAAVRFVEAYGLWLKRPWAEWFGLFMGGMYLPIEIYELIRKITWPRITLLSVNAGIVAYLATILYHTEIRKAELEQTFASVLASQGMPSEQVANVPEPQRTQFYRMVLDQMILDRLIAKRAKEEKVPDDEVTAEIAKIRKNFGSDAEMEKQIEASGQTLAKLKESIHGQLSARHWVDGQTKGKDAVTDAEAESFYKENPDKFKVPEKVRASHILIATPADAKPEVIVEKQKAAAAALARVNKGEDFEALAKELSDDPSAKQNGGDLNFFSRDQMVKEFADAAFSLKKDEVSPEPVRSQFGYHVIKVTDHHDAETVTLDKAKPQVLAFLQRKKKDQAVQEMLKVMRDKAEVTVNLPRRTSAVDFFRPAGLVKNTGLGRIEVAPGAARTHAQFFRESKF